MFAIIIKNNKVRIMIKKIILSAVVTASLVTVLNAKETELISHAELGYQSTSGNTETDTFTFDGNVKKVWDEHSISAKADAQYAKDVDTVIKNKFSAELKYNYAFTSSVLFDYTLGYKKDKFSAFNYQAYTGPGLKYIAINNKEHNLDFTGSILYSMDDYDGLITAQTDEYSSYKAELNYAWKIMETLKFTQDLSYRSSFEDSDVNFANSKSALITKISDMFSAGVSYKVDYTNEVPTGIFKSDKTLAINLILDY